MYSLKCRGLIKRTFLDLYSSKLRIVCLPQTQDQVSAYGEAPHTCWNLGPQLPCYATENKTTILESTLPREDTGFRIRNNERVAFYNRRAFSLILSILRTTQIYQSYCQISGMSSGRGRRWTASTYSFRQGGRVYPIILSSNPCDTYRSIQHYKPYLFTGMKSRTFGVKRLKRSLVNVGRINNIICGR